WIVAWGSFTASQTVTTVGGCATAPGSCSRCACNASEPDTPRLTYAAPLGRSAAIRAGHEPRAGSTAPTPTVSKAPMATWRTKFTDAEEEGAAAATGEEARPAEGVPGAAA